MNKVWLVYPDDGHCPPDVWATESLAYLACARTITDSLDSDELQAMHKAVTIDATNKEVVAWHNETHRCKWHVHESPVLTCRLPFLER